MAVTSELGRGSCFRIEVPVTALSAALVSDAAALGDAVRPLAPASQGTTVLVVDDEPDNRAVLRGMLEQLGFVVLEASDGIEGLQVFADAEPAIVLMDMRMPRMDGYEATRRIKASERGAHTPVIAVTASAFEDDEAKVLATGVDAYVRKPFRWPELLEVMRREADLVFLDEASSPPATPKRRAAPAADRTAEAIPARVDDAEARASLHRLAALLASNDTAVIDVFDAERAILAPLGDAAFAELERHLNGYDFPAALATVHALLGDDAGARSART